MATVKADILGEVEKSFDAAGRSKQVPADVWDYDKTGAKEPPYNLDALAYFLEVNTWHFRCCKTKAIVGRADFTSLADAWQFVIGSNAVMDILSSTRRLSEWARAEAGSSPVLIDFMLNRSTGRLRRTHIYEDTIAVLREIAQDHGVLAHFDASLEKHGFFPESIFYTVVGWPELFLLRGQDVRLCAPDPMEGA